MRPCPINALLYNLSLWIAQLNRLARCEMIQSKRLHSDFLTVALQATKGPGRTAKGLAPDGI